MYMSIRCNDLTLCFVFVLVSPSPLLFKTSKSGEPDTRSFTQRTKFSSDEAVIKENRKSKFECGTGVKWGSIGCTTCKIIVKGLQYLVRLNSSEEEIVRFATYVCKEFGIEDGRVCRSITMEFKVSGMVTRPVA